MSMFQDFLEKRVSVLTNDGKIIVGTLKGCDQLTNIILERCKERVYSPQGVEQVPLGLYLIRGDNVAVVGEVDENIDKSLDFSKLGAESLKPIVH